MITHQPEIKFFKSWIIFFVVATVGAFVAGAVIGFIAGMIIAMLGYPVEGASPYLKLLGFAIGTVVSFFCYKWTVTQYIVPQLMEKPQKDTSAANFEIKPGMQPKQQHGY